MNKHKTLIFMYLISYQEHNFISSINISGKKYYRELEENISYYTHRTLNKIEHFERSGIRRRVRGSRLWTWRKDTRRLARISKCMICIIYNLETKLYIYKKSP